MIDKTIKALKGLVIIALLAYVGYALAFTVVKLFNYLTTEYYFVRTNHCGYVVYAKNPLEAANWVLNKPTCSGSITEIKVIE